MHKENNPSLDDPLDVFKLAENYLLSIGDEIDNFIFKVNRFTNEVQKFDGILVVKCKSGKKRKLIWLYDEQKWTEETKPKFWRNFFKL